jgi:hypothetical protein
MKPPPCSLFSPVFCVVVWVKSSKQKASTPPRKIAEQLA